MVYTANLNLTTCKRKRDRDPTGYKNDRTKVMVVIRIRFNTLQSRVLAVWEVSI